MTEHLANTAAKLTEDQNDGTVEVSRIAIFQGFQGLDGTPIWSSSLTDARRNRLRAAPGLIAWFPGAGLALSPGRHLLNAAPAEQLGLVAEDRVVVPIANDERTLPRAIGEHDRVLHRRDVFHVDDSTWL